MRPIKIGDIEIPVVEIEGLEGAALVSPDAVAQVFTIDSNGKIVHVETKIDHSKLILLKDTPSEKGE